MSHHFDDFGLKTFFDELASILEGKPFPNEEWTFSSGDSQIWAFTVRCLCLPYVFTTLDFLDIWLFNELGQKKCLFPKGKLIVWEPNDFRIFRSNTRPSSLPHKFRLAKICGVVDTGLPTRGRTFSLHPFSDDWLIDNAKFSYCICAQNFKFPTTMNCLLIRAGFIAASFPNVWEEDKSCRQCLVLVHRFFFRILDFS